MLEHVAQTSSGVIFLGDTQNPTGCVPGQIARADLALHRGLNK